MRTSELAIQLFSAVWFQVVNIRANNHEPTHLSPRNKEGINQYGGLRMIIYLQNRKNLLYMRNMAVNVLNTAQRALSALKRLS